MSLSYRGDSTSKDALCRGNMLSRLRMERINEVHWDPPPILRSSEGSELIGRSSASAGDKSVIRHFQEVAACSLGESSSFHSLHTVHRWNLLLWLHFTMKTMMSL